MLLEVSPIEQEITIKSDFKDHFARIEEMCKDPRVSNMERLRLTALFALRYEKQKPHIAKLKQYLAQNGLKSSMISLIDLLIEYAGSEQR